MIGLLRNLLFEDDGPTAVEYAVMLASIVVVCMTAVLAMSNAAADSFDDSATQLADVLGS